MHRMKWSQQADDKRSNLLAKIQAKPYLFEQKRYENETYI